jgi:phosphomannomutase
LSGGEIFSQEQKHDDASMIMHLFMKLLTYHKKEDWSNLTQHIEKDIWSEIYLQLCYQEKNKKIKDKRIQIKIPNRSMIDWNKIS